MFLVSFFFPCAPPSSAGWSGDVGEDCLSAEREFRSRLTSRATQGTAKRRQTGGAFFWFLFLARQEKGLAVGLPPTVLILRLGCALIDGYRDAHPIYCCDAGFAHPSIRLRLLIKPLAIRLSPQAGKSLVIRTNGFRNSGRTAK
ncbi:MAG: hypothetical protein A2061_04060 [Gallionellales bacterium GWA2_59_43]|nr:MAG: hypothetical protein A2061_04060 [Gallionellales bacterium GWA2_59_43]